MQSRFKPVRGLENGFVFETIKNNNVFNVAVWVTFRGRSHALQDRVDLKSRRPHGVCSEEEHLYRLPSCAKDKWCVSGCERVCVLKLAAN